MSDLFLGLLWLRSLVVFPHTICFSMRSVSSFVSPVAITTYLGLDNLWGIEVRLASSSEHWAQEHGASMTSSSGEGLAGYILTWLKVSQDRTGKPPSSEVTNGITWDPLLWPHKIPITPIWIWGLRYQRETFGENHANWSGSRKDWERARLITCSPEVCLMAHVGVAEVELTLPWL